MSSSLKHAERSPEKIHYVGKSLPRPDAKTKVTGSAPYVMDFFPDDLLYAKLIQSTHSHAELVDIDISKAVTLEGVVGIFTSDDVPSIRRGQFILDQPIFAIDKVRYVGEPIGIVVAETEEIAEEKKFIEEREAAKTAEKLKEVKTEQYVKLERPGFWGWLRSLFSSENY